MGWIEQCRVFCQVVESGSFTRAAEALSMPRSTVSAVIKGLEARVNVPLLNRTTRRVSLTREGEVFLGRCLKLLQEKADMETMFRADKQRVGGRVRVSVPSRIGRQTLIPALPGFRHRWPAIRVEVNLADRAVDVPAEGVDCVLRVGAIPDDGLASRAIGDLEQINVASPAYLRAYGSPRMPSDLSKHRQVGYVSPMTGRIMDWEWLADGTLQFCQMAWDVSTDTGEGYIAAALAGLGLIQIPKYDVAKHIGRGDLVEVMHDWRAPPLPISIGLRRAQHAPQAIGIFVNWMEVLMKKHARSL